MGRLAWLVAALAVAVPTIPAAGLALRTGLFLTEFLSESRWPALSAVTADPWVRPLPRGRARATSPPTSTRAAIRPCDLASSSSTGSAARARTTPACARRRAAPGPGGLDGGGADGGRAHAAPVAPGGRGRGDGRGPCPARPRASTPSPCSR